MIRISANKRSAFNWTPTVNIGVWITENNEFRQYFYEENVLVFCKEGFVFHWNKWMFIAGYY